MKKIKIKEDIISFETAKLANIKGFNIKCKNPVNQNGAKIGGIGGCRIMDERIEMPTQALLQKWLRELYNIDVFVERCINGYNYLIRTDFGTLESHQIYQKGYCDKYEQSLEFGLKNALKLIES